MCEMPEVYNCDKPKARKDHRCCECRGWIRKGEIYHYHHGIWYGEGATYKVCEDCEALRERWDGGSNYDDMIPFEGLHEAAFECDDPDYGLQFIDIKRRRGAAIRPHLEELENELRKAKR